MIAVIAVQLIMPAFNGFLQREITFDYLGDPVLTGAVIRMALVTGLAAGIYPALVLSVFRPSTVLKGIVSLPGGSGRLRQVLVISQFAILIALIVSTITIQRQIEFSREDRLRFPTDEIYSLVQLVLPLSWMP